jgi:hypothetical protein
MPTTLEIIVSVGSSLLVIIIFYRDALFTRLANLSALSSDAIRTQYQHQLASLSHIAGLQNGFIAVFWAGIGLVIYLVYLGLSNALVELRNEVVIRTSYQHAGSLVAQLSRPLLQLILAAALLGATFATLTITVPFLLGAFGGIFYGALQLSTVAASVGSLFGLSGNMYVLLLMARIVYNVS